MKNISVHTARHEIDVYNDDTLWWNLKSFATGRQGHLTPMIEPGSFLSGPREIMHYSHTYKDAHGNPAAMPFAMFFNDTSGCAFHGGNPDLPSHGCIHLLIDDARRLFEWAGKDQVGLSIQPD